jgi:hypothetical protein
LAYADMPGLVQTAHLVFATILLAVLLLMRFDAQLSQHQNISSPQN